MQKAELNPSSGLPIRNPSHIFEADRAQDQSQIVKAIRSNDIGKEGQVTWVYDDEAMENPPPMSGIRKVREMTEDEAVRFCRSLMRVRPNVYRVHIVLGDYQHKRELSNHRVKALFSNEPRFHTEVGEDLGKLLADKTMFVTEVVYEVLDTNPGKFRSLAKVFGVNEADYNNDELFSPAIRIDFIKAT